MDPRPSAKKGPSQGQPPTEPTLLRTLQYDTDTDAADHDEHHHSEEMDTAQPGNPAPVPQGQPQPTAGKSQLREVYEHDMLVFTRLLEAGSLSPDFLAWMRLYLRYQKSELDGTPMSADDQEAMDVARAALSTMPPLPQTPTPSQAQEDPQFVTPPYAPALAGARTTTDVAPPERAIFIGERKRQRDSPISLTPPAAKLSAMQQTPESNLTVGRAPAIQEVPKQNFTVRRHPTEKIESFADAARKPATGNAQAKMATAAQMPGPSSTQSAHSKSRPEKDGNIAPAKEREGPRYPPLIVENLSNWTRHFEILKQKLGRTPNGRPFGKGIRFTPTDEAEYRLIQAYLSDLEKSENISWFSYSLPAERNLKVAIRGLPADTPIDELINDFTEKGFTIEYAKNIKGKQGRPGSIFYALFKKTPNLTPEIFNITEVLYMPGVKIEAWRGKKGTAQCHRCQKFRHSSHMCHRQQACVRCGEPHMAHECPRPKEEPPTCANCGGPHPANYSACPVKTKEARNKKAGTVAETMQYRKGQEIPATSTVEETAATSLMAPARDARDPRPSRNTRRAKKDKKSTNTQKKPAKSVTAAANATATAQSPNDSLGQTIGVLKGILEAVQAGTDAETATLMGLMKLLNKNKNDDG